MALREAVINVVRLADASECTVTTDKGCGSFFVECARRLSAPRARCGCARISLKQIIPMEHLSTAIRNVATGARSIAPQLAAAAWEIENEPLSERERAVPRLA